MDKGLCSGCDLCCRHVALEIEKPVDKEDFEQIRWFLLHENVWIFIDYDDSWNIQFNTKCSKLNKNGLCDIYEKRPMICKNYSPEDCEKNGEGNSFKILWKTVEEFEEWKVKNKL